jgi:dihydrolipoamide dehydrogenase
LRINKLIGSKFDVVVIGAGPGGYVAAIRSAQLGMKTAIVEAAELGGVCLNWGCIPTKALLRTAEIYKNIKNADQYGLSVSGVSINIDKVIKRSREISNQLNQGVSYLLKKNKVEIIKGWGKIEKGSNGEIRVLVDEAPEEHKILKATNVILATGARARHLPDCHSDGKLIWTYREAMTPDSLPKSLLVVGSGAIGIEFASFYNTLGSKVTVVEILDRILPQEDTEISELARSSLEKEGIEIHTSSNIKGLNAGKNSVELKIEINGDEKNKKFDRAIVAIGILGNVEGLGLEKTEVVVENHHVVTDEWCQTNEKSIWAIGDLVGPPWLAHKAEHEGVIAVERIAGMDGLMPLDVTQIPSCTYSIPQVASIGLTEIKAKELGYEIRVGRFPFKANGKALALGEPGGLVKTIFDVKSGELLGAHMIGNEVTELIQGYGIAKALETTEDELIHTVFPHPTLSESMYESVLNAYNRAIHI